MIPCAARRRDRDSLLAEEKQSSENSEQRYAGESSLMFRRSLMEARLGEDMSSPESHASKKLC